jgi:hypothetical protein
MGERKTSADAPLRAMESESLCSEHLLKTCDGEGGQSGREVWSARARETEPRSPPANTERVRREGDAGRRTRATEPNIRSNVVDERDVERRESARGELARVDRAPLARLLRNSLRAGAKEGGTRSHLHHGLGGTAGGAVAHPDVRAGGGRDVARHGEGFWACRAVCRPTMARATTIVHQVTSGEKNLADSMTGNYTPPASSRIASSCKPSSSMDYLVYTCCVWWARRPRRHARPRALASRPHSRARGVSNVKLRTMAAVINFLSVRLRPLARLSRRPRRSRDPPRASPRRVATRSLARRPRVRRVGDATTGVASHARTPSPRRALA